MEEYWVVAFTNPPFPAAIATNMPLLTASLAMRTPVRPRCRVSQAAGAPKLMLATLALFLTAQSSAWYMKTRFVPPSLGVGG